MKFDQQIVACGPFYTLLGTSMSTILLWGTRPLNSKSLNRDIEFKGQEQNFLINSASGVRQNRFSSAATDFSFKTNNRFL